MTKTCDTLIGFVLDRSGSMGRFRASTEEGFNTFLRQQQEVPGVARFSYVHFGNDAVAPFVAKKIGKVPPLGSAGNPHVIGGGTALFDAVGDMIRGLEAWEKAHDHRGQVMVTILTDGQENASTRWHVNGVQGWGGRGLSTFNGTSYMFSSSGPRPGDAWDLGELIKQKQEDGWQFVFLGVGGSDWLEQTFKPYVPTTQIVGVNATDSSNSAVYAAASANMTMTRSKGMRGASYSVSAADVAEQESKLSR